LFSTEERRVVQQLLADVRQTAGGDYEDVVLKFAEDAQLEAMSAADPQVFGDLLVDEFQQYLHDTFVDSPGRDALTTLTTRWGWPNRGGDASSREDVSHRLEAWLIQVRRPATRPPQPTSAGTSE
jgi:hypothetical protein